MATESPNQPRPPEAERQGHRAPFRSAALLVVGVALAAYLAAGFYFVQPDERAVVRRFGRVVEPRQVPPGLHYAWPWPISRVDKETTKVRRVTVGLDPEARAAIAAGDIVAQTQSIRTDVFTGDVNIVKATMVVQYQITDVDQYVTRTADPDELVRLAVLAVTLETLGGYAIDDALTEGKARIQNTTRERAQAMLQRYGCGITLSDVTLESIEPPHAINDAFRDVASAKKDCETKVDEAESFVNDILPKARGRAHEMKAEAGSYRQRRIKRARGEADRFLAVYHEYVKAPEVTRTRLLLKTLAQVFDKAETYVFTPNTEGPPLRITIGESGVD